MKRWYLGALCFLLLLGQAQARCALDVPATRLLPPAASQLLVVTQNAWLMHDSSKDFRYDDAVPPKRVKARIHALANYVIHRLGKPHLLALQEVENKALLQRLVAAIKAQGGPSYQIHILPNQDVAGNTEALLTRAPVKVSATTGVFAGKKVPGHSRSSLFSRLPLLVTLSAPVSMKVLVVHLRSAYGLHDADRQNYVRAKRSGQVKALIQWADGQSGDYLVLGDFNTGDVSGVFGKSYRLLRRAGWREAQNAKDSTNFTYIHDCHKQQLDHIYLSDGLWPRLNNTAYAHGNAGHYGALYGSHGTRIVSDHDAIGVYLRY